MKFASTQRRIYLSLLLFSGIKLRLIGDVYITEIALSIFAVLSIFSGRKVFVSKTLRIIPKLFISWFFANLISSFLSSKSATQTLIALFTVVISGLALRSVLEYVRLFPQDTLHVLILYICGRFLGVFLDPTKLQSELPWKFGYGELLIILTLIFVAKTKNMKLLWIGAPILIFVSATNQARTISFLLLGVLTLSLFNAKKKIGIGFLFLIVIIPIVSYNGYLELAISGRLGPVETDRARFLLQSDLGPLAARKEFVFSTRAFASSPIIGHGFDPQVSKEILESGYQELLANGIRIQSKDLLELPMHSFLMSALVQGGLFAGLFWIFVLIRSIKELLFSITIKQFERPLVAYISLALIDRVLVSPFGAVERLNIAFFFGYLLTLPEKKAYS